MVLSRRFKFLCLTAAAVVGYILVSGPRDEAAQVSAASDRATGVSTSETATAATSRRVAAHPAPGDDGSLLGRLAHRVTGSKAVDALFHSQSWYVAPPPPPRAPVVVVAPPPPTAPPLPYTAMGSYAHRGDATVYFLTRGDRVFDVHVGDTIDNTYTVDSAANGQLTLTYKPLNIQQTLAIGGSQ
ncbi:MAG: hypothetical protein ACRES2_07530 [Steroidobacteraceae bacterium]